MSSWLAGASSSSLTVAEADGTPSVSGVSTILVSNTTLTDNTGGSVTIAMTPAGGANTALSNLASVAVNANIVPASNHATDLGTSALAWKTVYSGDVKTDSGRLLGLTATAPAAAVSTTAGVGVNLTASAATAGTLNVGAAAGGSVTITSGAAARLTSGNANGGDIIITPGAGIGTGTYGILCPSADSILALGSAALRFTTAYASTGFSIYKAASEANPTATLGNGVLNFGAGTSNAVDVGLARPAAGLLKATDGSTGSGSIAATSLTRVAPTTDVAPSSVIVKSGDSFPGATGGTNTVGANTILAGGIGQRIFTVVAYDNGTVPLSTVTITVNGTATVKTEGTDWFDTTGNNEMATSLATAIDGIAGVSATASSAVVRIVPDVGTYSLTIAKTAADAGMTATSGTNGAVGSQDQLTILNAGGNIILDTNGAAGFRIRNAANDGYASSVSMGTAYVWGGNNINLINDASVVALGGSLGVGITYSAPGVMAVCNGLSSNSLGSVIASTAITAVGTATANGYIRTGVYKRAWTNAEVTAFGAVLSGDLKVATLPAKTIVRNAYLVIDSQAAGTTTLTASLGRTSAAYIDYVVASNAKVAANTVYGDVVGERGTNLTGYDLPAYAGTTDVYVQFVSTVENLSAVTTCTGTIFIATEVLP